MIEPAQPFKQIGPAEGRENQTDRWGSTGEKQYPEKRLPERICARAERRLMLARSEGRHPCLIGASGKELVRILLGAFHQDLEMQVRTCGTAG